MTEFARHSDVRDTILGAHVPVSLRDGRVPLPPWQGVDFGNALHLAQWDAWAESALETIGTLSEADRLDVAARVSDTVIDVLWECAMPWTMRLAVEWRAAREDALERWPERKLAMWLRSAMRATNGFERVEDPLRIVASLPRWGSGCESLDAATGGLYGVCVIGGETGVGKSTLAVSAMCEALSEGWAVAYLNAELDRSTLANYVIRYAGLHRAQSLLSALQLYDVGAGVSMPSLVAQIADSIAEGADRLLVVLDSVNTIAELAQSGVGPETYFGELRRWSLWAMQARKLSHGSIAFLVVSELNRRGETKGGKVDYVADLVVHVKRGETEGYMTMSVEKGRYSGRSDLGALMFDHRSGRFEGQPRLPEARDEAF